MYIYIYIHTYICICTMEFFPAVLLRNSAVCDLFFGLQYCTLCFSLLCNLFWHDERHQRPDEKYAQDRVRRFQYFVYVQVSYTCTKLYANVCLCMLHVYAYVYKHLYNNEVSITYSCKNPMHLQHFNGQRIAISPWWIERFVEVSSLSSKWRRISTPAAGGRSAALPSSAAGNPAMAGDFFGI